jgi:hypothetical protein
MARISRYPQDNIVVGTDKLIGTDEDGDVTKTYTLTSLGEWLKYNTQPIATLTSADGTQFIVAAANDGTIQGIPLDSVAPNITSLPVITGTLNVGETLTVAPGAFTGIPEPTTVLQWQRSDDGLTGWSDITGATSTTYLLGSLDEDKYIRVEQTEENILGTATANSASTTQIQPAAFIGLLDDYPNAAEAYSLRKLRNLYTGDAIRVTTNGSDSADIGFLSNGELDTITLETFANGNDVYVSTWYDQSGNGNDSVQTTFSQMPLIAVSGSTYTLNSKPSIKGTGSNQLILANELNIGGDFFISTTLQYAANRMVLGDYLSQQNFLYRTSDSQYRIRMANINTSFINPLAVDTQYNSNVLRYSNSINHSRNGLQYTTTGVLNQNFKINALLNGYTTTSFSMLGFVQEVIIWESDEQSNLTGIETNINDFYNIY